MRRAAARVPNELRMRRCGFSCRQLLRADGARLCALCGFGLGRAAQLVVSRHQIHGALAGDRAKSPSIGARSALDTTRGPVPRSIQLSPAPIESDCHTCARPPHALTVRSPGGADSFGVQVIERAARLIGALFAIAEVSKSSSRVTVGNPDWFLASAVFVGFRLGFVGVMHLCIGYRRPPLAPMGRCLLRSCFVFRTAARPGPSPDSPNESARRISRYAAAAAGTWWRSRFRSPS